MTARATTLIAVALVLGLSAPAFAQDEPADRFSGTFQLDWTNAYFFRGILNEREGIILQPWGELYYSLYSSEDGFLRDVSVGGGIWTTWHSERTLADEDPQWFYEADYYPIVSLGFAGGVSLTGVYYFYTSPNGAFTTVQELNLKLAWDDSEALGRFAMAPYVNFAIETHNTSFGPNTGSGVQIGAEPTLWSFEHERYPVKFTFPVELGLAIDNYYENADGSENNFGYVNFGLKMSVPLAFVPKQLGEWSFSLAAKGFYISDDIANASNGGHNWQPVVVGSLGVSF